MAILSSPAHPEVKVIRIGGERLKVRPGAAMHLIRSGDYSVHCIGDRRVKLLRENPVRNRWEVCYRTAVAPVLQPSIEWLRSRRSGIAELNY